MLLEMSWLMNQHKKNVGEVAGRIGFKLGETMVEFGEGLLDCAGRFLETEIMMFVFQGLELISQRSPFYRWVGHTGWRFEWSGRLGEQKSNG